MMRNIGATNTVEEGGWSYRVSVVADPHTEPLEGTCTTADREAFIRHEWGYVGIIVTAARGGIEFGGTSLWGIEDHPDRGSSHSHIVARTKDLMTEARLAAQTNLDRMVIAAERAV